MILAGLALLIMSLWLYFDTQEYVQAVRDMDQYMKGIYIFMVVGSIMVVVGFLGCCGALRESQFLLTAFFILLLVIFVAQVTGAVYAYYNGEELDKVIRGSMNNLVVKEYTGKDDDVRTKLMDTLQSDLHCCGARSPQDWSGSIFNGKDRPELGAISGTLGALGIYNVPRSCCRDSSSLDCESARKFGPQTLVQSQDAIYQDGCTQRLIEFLLGHMPVTLGVGITVLVIEILGMIFSMILCCAIRKIDDFKA
ncbi:unnamed protein product [Darwinula stevensoni]|uniref:Tetraspanin n=1 Tax=Darwinula stevensoni TaxID=69355 RepID=A0A7R8X975_9CRUS|nr:unnamed protein product [Darwinula stevensoni]CAG0884106.1 unnamed protein product [Darwinula stevensoni]